MKLDELKAKNKEEDTVVDDVVIDDVVVDDIVVDDIVVDDIVVDDKVDDDPEKKVLEPWQEVDDQTSDGVPVETHIKVKQKLKGRISERDTEIEVLKAEIEKLKVPKVSEEILKVPISDDFETDEAFQQALGQYHQDAIDRRFSKIEKQREVTQKQNATVLARNAAVDSHYDRASKLVKESGIDAEVYKQTDAAVRVVLDTLVPKQGDLIVDQLISILGEGSEKVMYFIGRNKTALAEVKSLMIDDPSGMQLAAYLGQQKERLTNPKRTPSRAPVPAATIVGDASANIKGSAQKKKYDAAHKQGNTQAAYNAKKAAKAAGVDVSTW